MSGELRARGDGARRDSVRELIAAAAHDLAQPAGHQPALYKLLQAAEQVLARSAPEPATLVLLRRRFADLQEAAEQRLTPSGLHALGDAIDRLDLALARLGELPGAGEDERPTVQLGPAGGAPGDRERARKRGERLRAIQAISMRLSAQHHEPRVCCAIAAEHLRPAIAYEQLTVAIVDTLTAQLHFLYAAGTGSDLLPPSRPLEAGRGDLAAHEDPLRVVVRRGEPLHLSTPHSELHLPLIGFDQRVLGVFSLYTEQPGAYDEEDVQFGQIVTAQLATAWQAVQLNRQVQRRVEELHTLHDATVAMTSDLSLEQVLETVGQHLIRAIGVQGARVLTWGAAASGSAASGSAASGSAAGGDAVPGRLTVLLDIADGPPLRCRVPGSTLARDSFPTAARVIATRTPAVVWSDDADLDPVEAEHLQSEGVRALLAVPLFIQGAVAGVVVLRDGRWPRVFSASDQRLAQMLANQAAVAIENARAYRHTTQLVTELTALRETALDLASELDFEQLLERVIERASHLLGGRGGALWLSAPDGVTLQVAISRVPWADYTGRTLRLGEGLAGRVAASGQPLAVDDYHSWDGRAEQFAGEPIRAAASVPLHWHGQVLGVLTVLDDRPGTLFLREDLELLAQFGPQATVSIRNAQLYQTLQRHVAELEQAQARLVQSEKLAALGRLAASIAHEVNNPLQAIQNCLHLCLNRATSESKRRDYLLLAQSELERLVTLVQRMLEFYRPSQEGRAPTQVNVLVDDVLALAGKQLADHRVAVERALDPELPAVLAVPGHLKQVFLNLILNAMEAMSAGGRLRVATRVAGERWVAIDFADSGTGIADDELPKIFEPFYTSKAQGSGLGLAVSYGIIEAHGGHIDVASARGEGTTFTLRLPLAPAREAETSEPETSEAETSEGGAGEGGVEAGGGEAGGVAAAGAEAT